MFGCKECLLTVVRLPFNLLAIYNRTMSSAMCSRVSHPLFTLFILGSTFIRSLRRKHTNSSEYLGAISSLFGTLQPSFNFSGMQERDGIRVALLHIYCVSAKGVIFKYEKKIRSTVWIKQIYFLYFYFESFCEMLTRWTFLKAAQQPRVPKIFNKVSKLA